MAHLDYINRSNLDYIETLFQQYLNHPEDISSEWRMFFNGMEIAQGQISGSSLEKEVAVFRLISTYRYSGHLKAKLNPLQNTTLKQALSEDSFNLSQFSLTEADLSKTFQTSSIVGLKPHQKLKDILSFLEKTYCGTMSLQAESCSPEIQKWFFNEFEKTSATFQFSGEQKKNVFYKLAKVEALEKFLHSRFVGAKRFSIEGGDALIPMLDYLVESGTQKRIKEVVVGMAHRGRLNVLNNFMNQSKEIVFMEFDGSKALEHFDFEGDVKYHMGYSSIKKFPDGSSCNVLLTYNPSHLEAVNSVVCGITRARQRIHKDQHTRKSVLPLLIHGDAAFSGQGCVSETLQLSQLDGFKTGGAIHIILNNQIGFTTNPIDSRSSVQASDLSKSIQAPTLLVNGDDIDNCIKAIDIALRFRQQFGKDIFIDLICYRRFGHNEGDEPTFTQPLMYQAIKKHPSAMNIYSKQLEKESILSQKNATDFYNKEMQNLQAILENTRKDNNITLSKEDLKGTLWSQHIKVSEEDFFKPVDTCPLDKNLNKVFEVLTTQPNDFHLHPKVKKLIENRSRMIKEDKLDWALCELAAYGTLCLENHPVRISGQDSQRGTFSHRHAVYFDTQTGKPHSPLSLLNPEKGEFCIYNSPLSEMAVLGFEYGNSCADHSFFTLWEAQFGDFCNGAQIIIDQFISSGEEKWMQSCSLVLLLPHGYEGQGPEHSSARLERWLQLCAQGNLQVCYPSTPANFFHLLRRQMKRHFYKPLIVMTPKSLLRHPKMISSKKELIRSRGFQEVLEDSSVKRPRNVEVLVLCSGKIFFDLQAEKEKSGKDTSHMATVRVEQLYPFPSAGLTPYLNGYPKLQKILWIQEEPANMGAWPYMQYKLRTLMNDLGLEKLPLINISRKEKASPATGSIQTHLREYKKLMKNTFQHL